MSTKKIKWNEKKMFRYWHKTGDKWGKISVNISVILWSVCCCCCCYEVWKRLDKERKCLIEWEENKKKNNNVRRAANARTTLPLLLGPTNGLGHLSSSFLSTTTTNHRGAKPGSFSSFHHPSLYGHLLVIDLLRSWPQSVGFLFIYFFFLFSKSNFPPFFLLFLSRLILFNKHLLV